MTKLQTLRPLLIGVAGACAVLALGLSKDVRAVAAALVTVTNTSANPVPVTNVDDQILHAFGTRVFPNVRDPVTITVPANKRLVINSITGFNNGNGSAIDLEVGVVSGGAGSALRIPFGAPQSASALRFLLNQNVLLVADPGSTVYFYIDDSDYNDYAGINIDVHGYYASAS
jgi:hypothetical protein